MKRTEQVGWIKKVDSFKYWGIKCSLSFPTIRREAKESINKNLQVMSWKLYKVQDWRVKETILHAYFRSLMIFHCTPLLMSNIIND